MCYEQVANGRHCPKSDSVVRAQSILILQDGNVRDFFLALWRSGLAEYDDMEGIAWRWQSIDGAMVKAPLAQETVGRNPTDRGKKRHQATSSGGRAWCPALDSRNRSKPA